MSILFQTNGIIIDEAERGEADRLLTVFTEDFGKIRLHARGSRKINSKLAGRLALFSLVDIQFVQGKRRDIITDAYLIDNFQYIKQDLDLLKIAGYVSHIIDNLIVASEKDKKLWILIAWVFESLDKNRIKNDNSLFLRLFEIKLLDYLGHLPNFQNVNHGFNFSSRITRIIDTLARDHQNIGQLHCSKKDLQDLQKATEFMMDMVY